MNLFNIFEEIEKADPEFQDRISPRRDAIKNMTSFGAKVAVASIPFALNALFKKAYGQTIPSNVTAVFTFALKAEYFGSAFYRTALASSTLNLQGGDRLVISGVSAHENEHVAFLRNTLGITTAAPADNSYDFTAKGTYPDVMSNVNTFLAVAQVVEDTEVRAYKGQAGALLGNQAFLTAALNIHSVEARHASAIRYLRKVGHGVSIKPWISGSASNGNDTGVSAADGNYAGESNTIQAGVDITKLPGASGTTPFSAAVEAFDEPLTMQQVLTLVAPFGVS